MPRSVPSTSAWLATLFGLTLAGTAGAENPVALDDLLSDGGSHRAYLQLEGGGYQPLSPIDGMNHLDYDFSSRLFQLPVHDAARPLTLVVQSADFEPHFISLETRSMENLGMTVEAHFTVEDLGDGDTYRVRLENADTEDDRVLLADLGWLNNGTYGVALSDPATTISEIYAPGTDHNPVSAEYTLGQFANRDGAPEAIRELRAHWQREISRQQASEYYGYIDESWQTYQDADDVQVRLEALQEVKAMAETYLADFPNGPERKEVQTKLETASERLDAL